MNPSIALARKTIVEMQAYSSARSLVTSGSIFLDANESPRPPAAISDQPIQRYPEPQPLILLKRLAEIYGVNSDSIMVGRGVDEAIDVVIRTFCEPKEDSILICPPTYGMYEIAAKIQGAGVVQVPLVKDFSLDAEAICKRWTPNIKIIFICSPNNPTGNSVARPQIEFLCREFSGKAIIVVDEAYVEFSSQNSSTNLLLDYKNLIILRTLSKAYALAGARCGSAIACPEIIQLLNKVRAPYPLCLPAIETVLKAIDANQSAPYQSNLREILRERESLRHAIQTFDFVQESYPTDANYFLIRVKDAAQLMQFLRDKGIILRDRSKDLGLQNCIRITIGTPPENRALLESLGEFQKNCGS